MAHGTAVAAVAELFASAEPAAGAVPRRGPHRLESLLRRRRRNRFPTDVFDQSGTDDPRIGKKKQTKQGLGPVLTASKPVYDLGGGGANGSGQAIVGVAAVDVPLLLFDAALPDSQLGFGGYKMAVTPTASAVLHPKLHHQQAYLDDPLMVPFEQLEPAGPWTEPLRRHLVDRQSGSQSYVGVEHVDGNYVVEQVPDLLVSALGPRNRQFG